ncbi:ABC-three component system middle component 2, partial [Escherichia coli]|uniref:ABC-three component system middle component 2 n=1 Tax=Escherichia coli TaxID=562 RepID=UPI0029162BE5
SILGAAYPQTYDLQRLVAFDYLLVHTGDIGGPDNLHTPTPMRSAELLVRRKLVEQSLLLMMTRDLVEREVTSEGIKY